MFANKYTSTNAHAAMNEDAGNRTRKASVQHLQFGAVGNLLDACMHAAGDSTSTRSNRSYTKKPVGAGLRPTFSELTPGRNPSVAVDRNEFFMFGCSDA